MDDFLTFALVSLLVEAPYLQKKEAGDHSESGRQRKRDVDEALMRKGHVCPGSGGRFC